MIELQVTLPDWAGEYIREQVAAGRYVSADELLAELIDQARVLVADDRLAELIREGMESGEGAEVTDEWWERRSIELQAEAERRRSA
jgi:Arc/MetJ-type ribon-helix-helix transcriptional regulator